MNNEGRRRKGDSVRRMQAEGRREQLIENPENYPISLPLAVDLQNPPITICSSNASHLNRSNPKSGRQSIEPSASCPLPSAFPRDSEDSPLKYLRCSPETINPAIVTARQIQHLELSGKITPEMMEQLAQEAQGAIAQGKQAIADYNYSLQQLKSASSQSNCIPWGF